MTSHPKITILGLGYVGLPLAVEFAKQFLVVGFDINQRRIEELEQGVDRTLEVDNNILKSILVTDPKAKSGLFVSSDVADIEDSDFYIVTVPTPTDALNKPIFAPLVKASETVGKVLEKDAVVSYESRVYAGVTEDICGPILEKESGLRFDVDFFAGYSPERMDPGDKVHT